MGMVKGGLVEVKDGLVVVDMDIAMLGGLVTVEVSLVTVEVGSVVNHGMLDLADLHSLNLAHLHHYDVCQ